MGVGDTATSRMEGGGLETAIKTHERREGTEKELSLKEWKVL